MSNNVYFGVLQGKELVNALYDKIRDYYEFVRTSRLYKLWIKSYNSYYGRDRDGFTTSEVGRSGVQGELSILKVNHYRNLINHLLVLTTQNRPYIDVRAINTDYTSQVQTILARGIIEYYMNEKRVDKYLTNATEYALVFGEGFTVLDWDAKRGEIYTTDEAGNPVYDGDCSFKNYSPLDVIRDYNLSSSEECSWYILRDFCNKYEIAEEYNVDIDELLSEVNSADDRITRMTFAKQIFNESDLIPVFKFVHKKTPALPEGRIVVFTGNMILLDSAYPYKRFNIVRVAPAEWIGSPFGYTLAFDLLALQDSVDALYSTVLTNQLTFGVQSIVVQEGSNLTAKKLATGLNLITYSRAGTKPEPLNLTYTPAEIFNFMKSLEQTMETLSGVNSVNRGNPEASLRSGNALALVASQAIQFSSKLQASYVQHLEDVFTTLITMLQEYATTPRIATILGVANRAYIKEFTGKDIDKINRVVVDLGNSVMRTNAGRLEVANNLLQQNKITPEQYLTVLTTGRLEPMYESASKELLLIRTENEKLSQGQEVIAIATDDHALHIKEHKNVLADPDVRVNPDTVQVTLKHMLEHITLLKTTDPNLLMLTGNQPIQEPIQQGGEMQSIPQEGNLQTVEEMQQQPDLQSMMPTNPLTGEKYQPIGV